MGSTYAINTESNLFIIVIRALFIPFLLLLVAFERNIGALALAHGLRPLQGLRGGGPDAVDATQRKSSGRGTLVRAHYAPVKPVSTQTR